MSLTTNSIKEQVLIVREEAEKFLTSIARIKRKTGESAIRGESVITYTDPVEISCRLIVRSGTERTNIASQERAPQQTVFTGFYRMQLPFGTEIREDDIILFEDISLETDRTFKVIYVPPFHDMMGAFVIEIQEVK